MLHHVISWRMAGRHADVDEAELAALAPGASGRDAVARAAVAAPPVALSRYREGRGGSNVSTRGFTQEEARAIGQRIGIHWSVGDVDLEQFRMGLAVELEHGTQDPATDVTHDDETITGKIALAHLKEIGDYYTRLAAMEREAER